MTRRRFLYTSGGRPLPEPIEVTDDWADVSRSTGDLGKFEYDNLRATDGADISSRTKRREYMKQKGITDASDFKETWARAEQERAAFRKGERVDPGLREAVGRAEYQRGGRR
jgi:hypothetical protein